MHAAALLTTIYLHCIGITKAYGPQLSHTHLLLILEAEYNFEAATYLKLLVSLHLYLFTCDIYILNQNYKLLSFH